MVRVFIRDKAPSDFRSFIATISRDKDMNLEDWVEEIASFAKQVEKDPKKVSKEERRLLGLISMQSKESSGVVSIM
jgi:predicted AAA+ superfamily ATPase